MTKGRRHKSRGLMTATAITVGWHMVRWRNFSPGGSTIVACGTVINDALVIKPGISKRRSDMAGRAIIAGWNVSGIGPGIFTGCRNAVVAGGTVINNTGMIKHRGGKRAGHVTGTAIFVCWHVGRIGPGIFARRSHTIMTGTAAFTGNFGTAMIHKSACEISGIMARPAILHRALMNWRSRCPPGSNRNIVHIAIMTRGTITADSRVSKNRWIEFSSSVTNVTVLLHWQMAWPPDSSRIVGDELTDMTTFTATVDFLMFTRQV